MVATPALTGPGRIGLACNWSLPITFFLGGQPAGCALDGSTDVFQTTSCALAQNGLQYILSFTGGGIPNNGSFVIAEDGVDPSEFPMVDASVTTAATPEPDSILLLSTGMLSLGAFFTNRNRRGARS